MNIQLRKIEERDFPALIELFKEFAALEKHPEKMVNSVEQMKKDKEFINGFVVERAGEMVAFTTFYFIYLSWTGKVLYMDDLYVTQQNRGNGIGSRLINEVISYAKQEGCKKMRWGVSNWNKAAIDFYKNLGAEIDEVELNCHLNLVERG